MSTCARDLMLGMKRIGLCALVGALACGDADRSAEPGPTPSEAKDEAPDDAPRSSGPKVTVDRSGTRPVVTAFGVQLTRDEPPPDAWHWHDGDVMLGGGPRLPMVRVEATTFTMGSSPFEEGRDSDEIAHEVTLSAYWIGATEVTRGQWRAVTGRDPSDCDSGCTDEHPVTQVSWEDAVGFCNTLSRQLGLTECYREEFGSWQWSDDCNGVRLPSEAEWENAARAGTSTPYAFGTAADLCENANAGTSWMRSCTDDYAELAPVRSFPANPWGIHDMHGNAREWVWDWYGTYPSEPVVDPRGPFAGSSRGLRGGSFENEDRYLRSAFRDSIDPSVRSRNMGVRVARSVPTR